MKQAFKMVPPISQYSKQSQRYHDLHLSAVIRHNFPNQIFIFDLEFAQFFEKYKEFFWPKGNRFFTFKWKKIFRRCGPSKYLLMGF